MPQLNLHKAKINELRSFLQTPTSQLLILQGPAGSGKSTCLRVLAQELNVAVVEWFNPTTVGESFEDSNSNWQPVLQPFKDFMQRLAKYSPLNLLRSASSNESSISSALDRIVLIRDLPNLTNARTRGQVVETISEFCRLAKPEVLCCIITNDYSFVNCLKLKCRLETITFNAVAKTFIIKILKDAIAGDGKLEGIPQSVLDDIAVLCNGDIRQALYRLEMYRLSSTAINAINATSMKTTKRRKVTQAVKYSKDVKVEKDFVKDEDLELLHFIGKLMHNKRLTNQQAYSLPSHLSHLDRGQSKYDIDRLLDSRLPEETELTLLYLDNNIYTFADGVDRLYSCLDYLSTADLFLSSAHKRSIMGVCGGGAGGETGGLEADYGRRVGLDAYGMQVGCRGILFENVSDGPIKSSSSGFQPIRKPVYFSCLLQQRKFHSTLLELIDYFYYANPNVISSIGGSKGLWNLQVFPFLSNLMRFRQFSFSAHVPSNIRQELMRHRRGIESARQMGTYWSDGVTNEMWNDAEEHTVSTKEEEGQDGCLVDSKDLWFIEKDDIQIDSD